MDTQLHEIMSITQEECAEVIQSISKIFRFGLDTVWKGESNREHLEEEIGDLKAMIQLMIEQGIISEENVKSAAEKKIEKLQKWSSISVK